MTAKDLKNALLQEAVQGKLVPQIASEGNAKDLLEEIKKEKAKLIKEGKLKKEKPLPEITDDEIPFDIPENWCWCRLGELGITITGSTPSKDHPEYFGNFIDFLSPGDIQNSLITYGNQGLSEKGYEVARPAPNGTILQVCIGGSIGKCAVVNREVTFNQQINSITTLKCNTQYVFNTLSSDYFYKLIRENSTGTATPIINKSSWEKLLIPLPPLNEQKRIVAAIEQFMPLIEEYGKKEEELTALNADIAKTLKNAILQEAVQGKLAPQIASEGSAKDLLEEIKKEKAKLIKEGKLKKEKPLPEISEDEIPFDIPENWCWCRLGEIVEFGKCENAEPNEINDEDWVLDLEDIEKDTGKILSFKIKKDVDSKSTKHIFKKDFVLYSKLRPYLNKCVIAPKDGFCTSEILPLNFGKYIYNQYAQLYLMSPFFVDYTNSLSYGVKMPRLGTEDGKNALFPLPPLSEQKRIVTTIEKMLPLCIKIGD